MLIFRYLAKEVFITLTALTAILLLIFMSNQLVQYLNRAASGQIPVVIILKLMMLEMPNLMSLLLPLGFYVALLLAYGRLYADSEMIVLQSCGYSQWKLLKHSLIMASAVTVLILLVMLWLSPYIATARAGLLRTSGLQTLIQTVIPGRFQAFSQGKQVFYVESMNRDHTRAQNIFLAREVTKKDKPQWDVLWAEKAFSETDPVTGEIYLILQQGSAYEGSPGRADYQAADFTQYRQRLPHPQKRLKDDIRVLKSSELLPYLNKDSRKAAELQWRLSIPIMVLTLTLVAVPLSRLNPRSGKYVRLLPAILIFIIYANFLFVARSWVSNGKIPVWLGIWWLHLAVALLGLLLMWRNKLKPA